MKSLKSLIVENASVRNSVDTFLSIPSAIATGAHTREFMDHLKKQGSTQGQGLMHQFDITRTHVGLGDFLMELVLAKTLQNVLPELVVMPEIIGRSVNLEVLEKSMITPEERMSELEAMLRQNPTNIFFRGPLSTEETAKLINIERHFGWWAGKSKFLSSGNVRLITAIHESFGVDPKDIFTWKPLGEYVGLHIRGTRHNLNRNSGYWQTKQDIKDLCRTYPFLVVRIFSKPRPSFLEPLVLELRSQGLAVEHQHSDGFTDTLQEILGADFWFQRRGGGVAVAPIYSKMPYVMLMSDFGAKTVYGISTYRVGKWSLETQKYITNQKFVENASLQQFLGT